MIRIPLTQGKFALIDDRDYWLVRQFTWCAQKTGRNWYARASVSHTQCISMHRLLAGFPPFSLDHKNGNGLDNRRRNLRPATSSEQAMNRRLRNDNKTGFTGVYWHKRDGVWHAQI